MRLTTIAVMAALAACAGTADARWMRATSRHFIVYSDDSEASVRAQATRLEQFDGVLRHVQHVAEPAGPPSNRVTVFVTGDAGTVQRLAGVKDIAGIYYGRASGSVAFTPKRGEGTGVNALTPQVVLFHEYAHHFMLGATSAAYPAWYSEGYAEFVSTTTFGPDYAQLGVAANHRAYGLIDGPKLSVRKMFASGGKTIAEDQMDALYGRGWLLTHYIVFDPVQGAKFDRYLALLNHGTPSLEAAQQAFGDLDALDRGLNRYLNQTRIPGMKVALASIPTPVVDVAPLTDGQAAMIDLRMRSTRGVDDKTAGPLYDRASKVAAAYPNDPVVQGWLAEMAYDAGRTDEADRAADRALAADPNAVQAMRYKAKVALRRASAASATDPKVWAAARAWLVKANHIDNDDAAILSLYYQSFVMAGAKPSVAAVDGVKRALELVPQDEGLRLMVVRQDLQEGDVAAARAVLRPLAYDPHHGADDPSMKLMTALDAAPSRDAALAALNASGLAGGMSD